MTVTRQFDRVLKIGIFLLGLLTVVMFYLYIHVDDVLKSTREDMVHTIVQRYEMFFENAGKMILDKADGGNIVEKLRKNPLLKRELERDLGYFKTPEVDNLFVIYKDAKGHYRYLLDTESDPSKKAMLSQRFEPVSPVWESVYQSHLKTFYQHVKQGKLWVTVAVPIVRGEHAAGIIGADLSASIQSDIESRFVKIKWIMIVIASIILMLLVFAYTQIYYYFKGRKTSFFDPLTEVYNRKFLYEVLANGEYRHYHLIILDLDHFKKINDTYGHDIGDKVLRTLMRRIRKQLREEDYIVRFGGEEFVIFLKTNDEEETKHVARRIKHTIENSPFVIDDKKIAVTVSMGVNTDTANASNLDEAIDMADKNLYCAKEAGRNRICIDGEIIY